MLIIMIILFLTYRFLMSKRLNVSEHVLILHASLRIFRESLLQLDNRILRRTDFRLGRSLLLVVGKHVFYFPFFCQKNLLTFFAWKEDVAGSDFGLKRDSVFVGDCCRDLCRLLCYLPLFLVNQHVGPYSSSCQEDVRTFLAWKEYVFGTEFSSSFGYVLDPNV